MPNKLLEQARLVCQKNGVRFTPVREQVFSLLADATGSVGAYELLTQLQQTDAKAKPPTIYRALEFLIDQGFVHKVESQNAYVLCSHFSEHHKAQLLICDSCGLVEEIENQTIYTALSNAAHKTGFTILKPTIEAHGLCAKCAEENP
ncbi:zinc uptake regulation protein [Catenovulum agarivorans DS-2]|uniref:Ferric uptake regulation protein n=1 Tax=Catenovulum agarivorans DS-2 TaxID=1328313 RepID=W7QMJ6_9ALTE|nr:transcriptional repressor [Catenovulum agarivorans]EWH10162.1 zinc uptake regulation protein [Catenovulum agarivorans DS-2]